MALSLSGERSVAAATPVNPFVALAAWVAKARAARTRRTALVALLQLDYARMNDLGISRADIHAALSGDARFGVSGLNAARARNAAR